MKKLYTLLFTIISFISFGSHLSGGDIQYRYIGDSTGVNHQYEVYLRVYRDVSGIPMLNTQTVYVNSGCYSQLSLVVYLEPGSGFISPTLFDCVDPGPNTKTLEIYSYKGVITLPGTCNNFTFWWEDCCRPPGINNISISNGTFGADGFYFDAFLNNSRDDNSSPLFISEPVRAFCIGNNFNWAQNTFEIDGDSIYYSLINCREGIFPGTNIQFDPGWTANTPITSSTFTIDPKTGNINFTPTMPEISVASVLVEEFRYDSLYGIWFKVGSSSRDMMVQISQICNQSAMNGVNLDLNTPNQYMLNGLPTIDYPCLDTIIEIQFDIKIDCRSISSDGTDFRITEPNGTPLPISKITANCDNNDEATSIFLHLYKPLMIDGIYYVYSKVGTDGNTLLNKCGIPMDEFDTLAINVDNCPVPFIYLDNVTVVNDNYNQIEWSIDMLSLDPSYFNNYTIQRQNTSGSWVNIGTVTNINQKSFLDYNVSVDYYSYDYRIYMSYGDTVSNTTRDVHSILLKTNGFCDSTCLRWNGYNGWDSALFNVYIYDVSSSSWVILDSLIKDSSYCVDATVYNFGESLFKVTTTDSTFISESNWTLCVENPVTDLYIPNTFTPNGDGINDYFRIPGLTEYEDIEIKIYNRWGSLVFESTDNNSQWDGGRYPEGVYYGVLKYDGHIEEFFVTLFR